MIFSSFNSTSLVADRTSSTPTGIGRDQCKFVEILQILRGHGQPLAKGYRWPGVSIGCFLLLTTSAAFGAQDAEHCILAHAKAQELEEAGKLLEARQVFDSCSTSACPKVVQNDCKVLGRAVEKAIPSLSVIALDRSGQALANYSVELDGVELPASAMHEDVAVDPGKHRVRLLVSGHAVVEVLVPVRDKVKDQNIVIQVAAPESPPPNLQTAGFVFAGIATLSALTFGGFAIGGYLDERKLRSNTESSSGSHDYALVDRMRQKYIIADTALGIGLVSLGAATYLLYVSHTEANRATSGSKTAVYLRGSTASAGLFVGGEF